MASAVWHSPRIRSGPRWGRAIESGQLRADRRLGTARRNDEARIGGLRRPGAGGPTSEVGAARRREPLPGGAGRRRGDYMSSSTRQLGSGWFPLGKRPFLVGLLTRSLGLDRSFRDGAAHLIQRGPRGR